MKRNRPTDFGTMVKKRLIDLNMTQEELAKKVGITGPYLNQILNGSRPGKGRVSLIIEVLDIDQQEIPA